MATGSQGFAKPVENPMSNQGKSGGTAKPGYSQIINSLPTGRDVPRSLPFGEDGEKGGICSLLLSPQEVRNLCILHLGGDAFYIPALQIIYDLVLEFADKSKPIEFVALKQSLSDRNQLEEVGGAEY